MKPPTADQLASGWQAALASGHVPEADRLARLLDGYDRPPAAPPLGSAALWYAQHGLHVFPLMVGSKEPFPRSHGCKDATTDVERVRAWWGAAPHANIGLATGHRVDVIDVDGFTGNQSLCRLPDGFLEAVRAWQLGQVTTPRPGGRHYYLPTSSELGNGAALATGIDYRGLGGYVVAPPSRTPQGTYRWLHPLTLKESSE